MDQKLPGNLVFCPRRDPNSFAWSDTTLCHKVSRVLSEPNNVVSCMGSSARGVRFVSEPKTRSLPDLPGSWVDHFCPATSGCGVVDRERLQNTGTGLYKEIDRTTEFHNTIDRTKTVLYNTTDRTGTELYDTTDGNGTELHNITDRSSREHHTITDRSRRENHNITDRNSTEHHSVTDRSVTGRHNITGRSRRELSKNAVPSFSAIEVPQTLSSSRSTRRGPKAEPPMPGTHRSSATVALSANDDEILGPEVLPGTALSFSRTDTDPEEGGSPGRGKKRLRRITRQGLRSFFECVNLICPYREIPQAHDFENLGARIGVAYRVSEDLPCYQCTSKGEDLSRCVHNTEGGRGPKSAERLTWIWPLPAPPGRGLGEDPPPYELHHLFLAEYVRPPTPLLQAEKLRKSLDLDDVCCYRYCKGTRTLWVSCASGLLIVLIVLGSLYL